MNSVSLHRKFVMERVSIDLENCYGIKRLTHEFNFAETCAYALYAPNGVMKSSLALTFQDIENGDESSDRIFRDRKTKRRVVDEAGDDIGAEQVLVVEPYNDKLAPDEKTSTLLVNAELREEYSKLHVAIDDAKNELFAALKAQSGSKRDFEQEIATTFTAGTSLHVALNRIRVELGKQTETPFAKVQYERVFDNRILQAISDGEISNAIEEYVRRYNELLDASTFFRKGTFDYYNAGQIATSLTNNGFFSANHTVRLNANGKSKEVSNKKELETVIAEEKDAILQDQKLRQRFDAVAAALDKNATLREFRAYMQDNEALLSQVSNIKQFKENVLKSYLRTNYGLFQKLMSQYDIAEKREKEIQEEAARQRTQWEQVIEIFNERFIVPFVLETRNKAAVCLGQELIAELGFIYHDGDDNTEIEKDVLLQALSTGEKKSFYILNVIFEVERRKKDHQETIIIIDDLADSFDYQNKYAIIQYLKDISEDNDGLFKQMIMTHNFDFFRTIESRFVGYSNCLMATKNANKELVLSPALGIRNVFVRDWKRNFFNDPKKKIACVPFLRNLVEYTEGDQGDKFQKLTSILHWNADSSKITVKELDNIYMEVCKENGKSNNEDRILFELINEEADQCLNAAIAANFENKIILAIAIRLCAERFMAEKINDEAFVSAITVNQSYNLAKKYKELFDQDRSNIELLDRVLLMTPENLHLNSFMYEPIVDMSDEALKRLYTDVKKLA